MRLKEGIVELKKAIWIYKRKIDEIREEEIKLHPLQTGNLNDKGEFINRVEAEERVIKKGRKEKRK